MDLQKTKILLEKINALYRSMSADARNISSIEKDLMKSYVVQFYENLLDSPAVAKTPETPPVETFKPSPKLILKKTEPTPEPPPPLRQPEPEPPKPIYRQPEPEPEPPKPIYRQPEPEPEPPKPIYVPPIVEAPPAPAPMPKIEYAPPSTPKPDPIPPATSIPLNEEMEELFQFAAARDLSEKLSETNIGDIKKAMALNDRLLTVKELFGNDLAAFDRAVDMLNNFSSFQQAKTYIIQNVAEKYSWTAKDKKSKAKIFLKLVKRRYN